MKDVKFHPVIEDETIASGMLIDALSASVKRYLVPDCGVLFSGGVDSSVVAALTAKNMPDIRLFTVGLEDSNDIKWAATAAELLGLEGNLTRMVIGPGDVELTIPIVLDALGTDDPMTISLAVPMHIACTEAKSRNISLLLAGQGADELFGGYNRYKRIAKGGMDALHDAIASDVANLPGRDIKRDNTVAEAAGMRLETPFLDSEVVELGLSIPEGLKVREVNGEMVGKYILRKAAAAIIPGEIAWRDKKALQYGSGVWTAMGRLARQAGFSKQDKGYIRKYLYSVAEEYSIELDVTL